MGLENISDLEPECWGNRGTEAKISIIESKSNIADVDTENFWDNDTIS